MLSAIVQRYRIGPRVGVLARLIRFGAWSQPWRMAAAIVKDLAENISCYLIESKTEENIN